MNDNEIGWCPWTDDGMLAALLRRWVESDETSDSARGEAGQKVQLKYEREETIKYENNKVKMKKLQIRAAIM